MRLGDRVTVDVSKERKPVRRRAPAEPEVHYGAIRRIEDETGRQPAARIELYDITTRMLQGFQHVDLTDPGVYPVYPQVLAEQPLASNFIPNLIVTSSLPTGLPLSASPIENTEAEFTRWANQMLGASNPNFQPFDDIQFSYLSDLSTSVPYRTDFKKWRLPYEAPLFESLSIRARNQLAAASNSKWKRERTAQEILDTNPPEDEDELDALIAEAGETHGFPFFHPVFGAGTDVQFNNGVPGAALYTPRAHLDVKAGALILDGGNHYESFDAGNSTDFKVTAEPDFDSAETNMPRLTAGRAAKILMVPQVWKTKITAIAWKPDASVSCNPGASSVHQLNVTGHSLTQAMTFPLRRLTVFPRAIGPLQSDIDPRPLRGGFWLPYMSGALALTGESIHYEGLSISGTELPSITENDIPDNFGASPQPIIDNELVELHLRLCVLCERAAQKGAVGAYRWVHPQDLSSGETDGLLDFSDGAFEIRTTGVPVGALVGAVEIGSTRRYIWRRTARPSTDLVLATGVYATVSQVASVPVLGSIRPFWGTGLICNASSIPSNVHVQMISRYSLLGGHWGSITSTESFESAE